MVALCVDQVKVGSVTTLRDCFIRSRAMVLDEFLAIIANIVAHGAGELRLPEWWEVIYLIVAQPELVLSVAP